MKKFIVVAIVSSIMLSGCAPEGGREAQIEKDEQSAGQGLHRTVDVYSQDGKTIIKHYEGKFDVDSSNGRIKFDLWGKRVLIYNSPVIIEEK